MKRVKYGISRRVFAVVLLILAGAVETGCSVKDADGWTRCGSPASVDHCIKR